MQVAVLGPLEVRAGGATIPIRRGYPRLVLVALALRAGQTVSADTLIDLLWGDAQPSNPANALQVHMSYLRKTLAALEPDRGPPIETRPGGYALVLAPDKVDVCQFETLVRQATALRAGATSDSLNRAVELLDTALSLWRGPVLADIAGEPFAAGDIARLDEARWASIEMRNDLLLDLGRHREIVGNLTQLVNEHPFRERFHEQLMLALYRCGRQADALDAYEHARSVLVDELGLEPGTALRQLEHAILEQDPDLNWVPARHGEVAASMAAPNPGSVLPVPVTALVGRDVEVERTEQLLGRNRIVTLTGPGGGGKSRLALELARRRAAVDRVRYVDLGTVSAPDRVAATIAAAVGVPSAPDEDMAAMVAQALSRERGLLVLDTCEHVLSNAAEVAVQVLSHCPGIQILATSRRPLGITGEVAWPVPPLAMPPPDLMAAEEISSFPAVALFIERAAAVRPGFTVTETTATDVAAICLALDGLPLAIELAAARTDVLTPAAIRARLQNRFDLLVDGGRQAAARQQTLRSAIDWSFELLDREERLFFVRLGVFSGSFDLDAAAAVAGVGLADPLSLLSTLVRSSMVAVAGDDRYRLLDTLRVYAAEKLEAEDDGTSGAHARHYTVLAEECEQQIVAADQVTWLARVRADVPNFRAAVEWSVANGEVELAARLAGALSWFWTLEGMLAEAVEHLERMAPATTLPPLIRSRVLSGLALLSASLGRLDRAKAAAIDAAALGRKADSAFAHAFGLNALAVVQWALGNLEASAATHDAALARLKGTDNPWLLGVCLALRARTALDSGDPAGKQMAAVALQAARVSGDRHVIGLALLQIAQLHLAEGEVASAIDAANECLRMQEDIAYTEGVVAALHVLARSVAAGHDTHAARALHLRALALADRIGHVAGVCEALEGLAALAAADGDLADALPLIHAAEHERRIHDLPLRAPDRTSLDALLVQADNEAERHREPGGGTMTEGSTPIVIARLLQRR